MDPAKQSYFRTDDLVKLKNRLCDHVEIARLRGPLVRDGSAKAIFDVTAEMHELLYQIESFIPERGDAVRYATKQSVGNPSEIVKLQAEVSVLREQNRQLIEDLATFKASSRSDDVPPAGPGTGSAVFDGPPKKKRGRPKKAKVTPEVQQYTNLFLGLLNAMGVQIPQPPASVNTLNRSTSSDPSKSNIPTIDVEAAAAEPIPEPVVEDAVEVLEPDSGKKKKFKFGSKDKESCYKAKTEHFLVGSTEIHTYNPGVRQHKDYIVPDGKYYATVDAMGAELAVCGALLDEAQHSDIALATLKTRMTKFRQTVDSLRMWHEYGTEDKKQIVKTYSKLLTKYSLQKYDTYPGLEEWFDTLNFWFQHRFKPGGKFCFNCSSIPKWIEDITMVLGNEFHTSTWEKSRDAFKNWCLSLDLPPANKQQAYEKLHYAYPIQIHGPIQAGKIDAFRNIALWDVMNAVGFFEELNDQLPHVCQFTIWEQLSWSWPIYALRNRIDAQPNFEPDHHNETFGYNYYVPGKSLDERIIWLNWDTSANRNLKYDKMCVPFFAGTWYDYMKKIVKQLGSTNAFIEACCT